MGEPVAVIPTAPVCDALWMPENWKRGRSQHERTRFLQVIANPLLGVDEAAGELTWLRVQPGGWVFATKDPDDTIFGALNAPPHLRGKDRYDWVPGEGGLKRGYLKAEFRGVEIAPFDPVAAGLWRPAGR